MKGVALSRVGILGLFVVVLNRVRVSSPKR